MNLEVVNMNFGNIITSTCCVSRDLAASCVGTKKIAAIHAATVPLQKPLWWTFECCSGGSHWRLYADNR